MDRSVIIHVPNIISTNTDGSNDYFNIFTKDPSIVKIDEMKVFDRWGNLVYIGANIEPNNRNQGWDGTFKGKPVEQGVYVYMINVTLRGDEKRLLKGDITVLR